MRSHIRKFLAVVVLSAFVAAVTLPADAAATNTPQVTRSAPVPVQVESGQGILGCAACAFGAGLIAAGGIVAIVEFLATPGSEALLAVCAIECGL